MIAWFPKLSPDGQAFAFQAPSFGYQPCWLNDQQVIGIVGNGPGLKINGVWVSNWPEPSRLCAGSGLFGGDYWGDEFKGLRLSDGRVVEGAYHSAMADDGVFVYLLGHDDRVQTVIDSGGHSYDTGSIEYPSISRHGVVWTKYKGGDDKHAKETWGAERGGRARRLHASGDLIEFGPVSVDTPDGLWVAAYRHDGVVLYPWGSDTGYLYTSPDARAVDAKWNGQGIRVVWNAPNGELFDHVQDLSAPRLRLAGIVIPEPPVITPDPENTVRLSQAVQNTIRAIFPRVAQLHKGNDDDRRKATRITVEQIVFEHPNEGIGCKQSSGPQSKDSIAMQRNGRLYGLDHIDGGTRELVDLNAEMDDITGQTFIPVAGVDHLNGGAGGDPGDENPPSGTHAYEGGDNDTGECDVLVGGVKCNLPPSAPIHQVAPDKPPPDKPPTGPVTNAQILNALAEALRPYLGVK